MPGGIEDKYADILGLPAAQIDPLLHGPEQRLSLSGIAGQLDLAGAKVAEIAELARLTNHRRNPSQTP